MLNLKSLLTREELATINAKLDAATWVDGRETASGPTRKIKNNLQLGSEDPLARELGEAVKAALLRNDLLLAAAFPDRVAPVRFAAYRPGMTYGWHADLAHMRFDAMIVRADVACTVFLAQPETYQGGELAIRLPVGELRVKFQAGDAVVYPANDHAPGRACHIGYSPSRPYLDPVPDTEGGASRTAVRNEPGRQAAARARSRERGSRKAERRLPEFRAAACHLS